MEGHEKEDPRIIRNSQGKIVGVKGPFSTEEVAAVFIEFDRLRRVGKTVEQAVIDYVASIDDKPIPSVEIDGDVLLVRMTEPKERFKVILTSPTGVSQMVNVMIDPSMGLTK
jgi:RNase P/RNase MRP subunit p29